MKRETQGEYHLRLWTEWLPSPWFVYVIQGDPGTPIKVGYTTEVRARIASLQTGNPQELRLLHVLPGSMTLEWNLHQRLKNARIRGEWFAGPEVTEGLAFIHALADWMVEGYREKRRIPDYRMYGEWFHKTRKSGDPPTSRFVDPETIRPEGWEPYVEPEPGWFDEAMRTSARGHKDSPFNTHQQPPAFQPHKPR